MNDTMHTVKVNEPVLRDTEQSFRDFVSKAFEDAGFDGASLRRLDEFLNDLAREAGVQVKELRIGVEETVVRVKETAAGVDFQRKFRAVPILKPAYGDRPVVLADHFTQMSRDSRTPGAAGFSSKHAGRSSNAYNYWKNKDDAELTRGAKGPNMRETPK